MSEGIVYLGEALGAAGLRLAGVEVLTPAPAELEAAFAQARARAALVLLSRRAADALPPGTLAAARRAPVPLVAVLPPLAAPTPDTALAERVRALLGIAP